MKICELPNPFGESPTDCIFACRSDMVRTNLTKPPQKKAKGITTNEQRSNPPKKRWDDLPPGYKGKRKKHIARKKRVVEPQVDCLDLEDEELMTH
uniref:Uncharacterized protein n=1 Tax=Solanum tuberosum TaxID=4113 RepID=M1E005_SOLTU